MSSGEAGQVRKVLAAFRERPLSLDQERLEQRRERVVPRLRAEVRARHAMERRRRRLRRVASVLALAATAALVVGLTLKSRAPDPTSVETTALVVEGLRGESSLWTGVERHQLVLGEKLKNPVQGQLQTADSGWARLRTGQGLSLALSGATAVELGELRGVAGERRVFLTRGELSCEVPKLPAGEQFVVVTPDARVVVHGTAFTVRVAPSATCVRVQHGTVSVHRPGQTIVLRGGEGWGCEQSAALEPASEQTKPVVAAPAEVASRRGVPQRSESKAPSTPEGRPGTLAQETGLLQAALAAERRGDLALARSNLRELVSRYPSSPLAAEAGQALERLSR